MSIGTIIRERRQKLKMSGVSLAARTGLNQSYLSKLERGLAGWSREGLESIARALGMTPAQLLEGQSYEDALAAYRVPLYSTIPAGEPRTVAEYPDDDLVEGYILCDLARIDELFALRITGRSMEPEFRENDIAIFRRDLTPNPGNYVAAVDDDGMTTFKRYKELSRAGEGQVVFALVALNDDYASYRSDETAWKVSATLVRHIRDYRK